MYTRLEFQPNFHSHTSTDVMDTTSVFSIVFFGGILLTEMYLLGKIFIENTFKKENDTKESKTRKIPGLFNEINSENKQVIIVRGVPGSGRRTLINEYTDYIEEENHAVCDVNDFFTNKSGDYKYVHKDAVKAEDETLIKFLSALEKGHNIIFVSGSFYEKWMYKKYQKLAENSGYEFNVISIICDTKEKLKIFNKRSVHNVPYSRSLKIFENWEHDDENEIIVDSIVDELNSDSEDDSDSIETDKCLIDTDEE